MPVTSNPRLGARVNQPYILAQSAVPVALCSSGTMGNNGAISGLTALPATYSGGIWLRLPANAIQAGSAAGLYWAVMSSTTAGTVYNVYQDPASPFTPYIPAVNTPFVSTGPGAFTQTTASDITLVNVTVPGGAMGPNGAIRYGYETAANSNANLKNINPKLAGTAFSSLSLTSLLFAYAVQTIRNMGVQNRNRGLRANTSFTGTAATGAETYATVDTSVDTAFTLTANMATATDYMIIHAVTVEVIPS